jgi:hypothetical protein
MCSLDSCTNIMKSCESFWIKLRQIDYLSLTFGSYQITQSKQIKQVGG